MRPQPYPVIYIDPVEPVVVKWPAPIPVLFITVASAFLWEGVFWLVWPPLFRLLDAIKYGSALHG